MAPRFLAATASARMKGAMRVSEDRPSRRVRFESKDIWRADDYSARPPIRGANIATIWANRRNLAKICEAVTNR